MSNEATGGSNAFNLSEFHSCALVDDENMNAPCMTCKSTTQLFCKTCRINCCTDCYDSHRRERFRANVKIWKQELSADAVKLSECAKFIKVGNEVPVSCSKNNLDENNRLIFFTSNIEYVKSELIQQANSTKRTLDETFLLVNILHEYGVYPQIEFDEDKKFKYIYIQDAYMKDYFNFFPHRICINVAGRIPNIGVIYLFASEDSNGSYEVISIALDTVEDDESIKWILDMFKKHNPSWKKIQMFIVDTLIKHRDVVQEVFLHLKILASYYQMNRTMQCLIDQKGKLPKVSCFEKNAILQNITNVALACTSTEYSELCKWRHLMDRKSANYLQKTWSAKNVWEVKIEDTANFLSNLNEYLTYIELKLQPVLCVKSDLIQFIRKFFFILKLLRTVRKNTVVRISKNIRPSLYSRYTPQYSISNLLTDYGSKLVIDELEKSEKVDSSSQLLFIENLCTTIDNCSCKLFGLTGLPCSHIFVARKTNSKSIYQESLFESYWTKHYYVSAHNFIQSGKSAGSAFKDGLEILDAIIPSLDCLPLFFSQHFSTLNKVLSLWEDCKTIDLHFDGNEAENVPLAAMSSESGPSSTDVETENVEKSVPNKLNNLPKTTSSQNELGSQFMEVEWNFGKHLFQENISLVYLQLIICSSKYACVSWLQKWNFLSNSMFCASCGSEMVKKLVNRMLDGVIWICKKNKGTKKNCAKRSTVRRGTWFEATNMELFQILRLCYMWIYDYSPTQIIFELAISSATYTTWDKTFTKVCSNTIDLIVEDISSSTQNAIKSEWLRRNGGKDIFIAFLQDSAALHESEKDFVSEYI